LYGNYENKLNREVTWQQTSLGYSNQLTWGAESIPCLQLDTDRGEIYWKWRYLADLYNTGSFRNRKIKWKESQCGAFFQRGWKSSVDPCVEAFPDLSACNKTFSPNYIIQVLELPPIASISAINISSENNFPYTVKLTPCLSQCGSFPIERIDWDLGDGSPILTQRRNNPTLQSPFVYNGIFVQDYKDPRNFDVVYAYKQQTEGNTSFVASLTAYAGSTSTTAEDQTLIGPISSVKYEEDQYKLNVIQNISTPSGNIVVSQINNNYCLHQFLE
jgi:hypothetical protein